MGAPKKGPAPACSVQGRGGLVVERFAYLLAAGAAAGACVASLPCFSPLMSISPPLDSMKIASAANTAKPASIFHMVLDSYCLKPVGPGLAPARPLVGDNERRQSLAKMSRSFVSRRNSIPITNVAAAMMIGYHKPLYMLPVAATIAKDVVGNRPPNQPLPMW